MNGRWRLLPWIAGSLALIAFLSSIAIVLPIRGRVVDAKTQQPIGGAAVIAAWQLQRGGFETVPQGQLRIIQTRTDIDGRYRLGAGVQAHWRILFGYVSEAAAPRLFLLRRGYEPQSLINDRWSTGAAGRRIYSVWFVHWSQWDAMDIALAPMSMSERSAAHQEAHRRKLDHFRAEVVGLMNGPTPTPRCLWDRIASMLLEIEAASALLGSEQISRADIAPEIARCGQEVFYGEETLR